MLRFQCLRAAAWLLLACFPALPQAQSGSIVGTVVDQGGAVVPGATVVFTNEATQFQRSVTTNNNGQYSAIAIPTGRYTARVEQAGFQTLVRSGIVLTAADTQNVDLQLTLGDVQQSVEVTSEAPLVQSQTATVSNLVSNQQILEMPLNGRTFTGLLLLSPGASTGSSNNLTTSPYAMRGSTNISVNGSSPQNNSYLIDGMVNRNLWLSTLIMVPTIDSIQEMRVMTSNYSAEYGSAAGAVTIVQTKSGTNEYHGSAYEFLRNSALDANRFFNNRKGVEKPQFQRNEFGGTFGGPIFRDKTFFFSDYQGIRLRQPTSVVASIPTLEQRQMILTGDFSGLGVPIYDPLATVQGPNGTTQRVQFPGNRILLDRLDPAVRQITNLLPEPTNTATTRNFVFNPKQTQRTDQFDVRIDQNIGEGDLLFGKYSYDNTDLVTPGTLPAPANANVPIGEYLAAGGANTGVIVPLVNQSFTLNYTKVFSPSVINEFRAGVVRWNQNITPLGNEFDTASALGIPGININNRAGGLPALNITGYQGLGDASTFPETSQTTSFQYDDILTWIRGAHTLKFGGQFVRHRFNGFSAFPTRGDFAFNGQFTRQIGTSGAQTTLADWALGYPSAVTRNILSGTFGMRFWNLAGFADDTWRINNRLTLNFGLRYELQAPPLEVYDRWSNLDVNTGQLLVAGRNGNSRRLRNFDKNNWAPRTGITYLLTSDGRTVFRSGFGVSYVEAGQGGGQLYKNLPFFFSQVVATDQNGRPPLRLSDGLATPVQPDENDIAAISSGNPNAWDMDLQATQTIQWSAGIQRELVRNLLVDVSYVGTRTLDLIANVNINQSFPGAGPQDVRRPFYSINPNLTNVQYRTNYGAAKYHSLQARVEKRYSAGLTGSLAYTWSHYLSNAGQINGGGNGPPQDARCYACEWGNMPEDRRHMAVINHVYELPFGRGRQWMSTGPLSWLVGPWTVSGIWRMSTGEHFTPALAAAVSNSAGGGGQRPNRIADGNLPTDQRTIDRWFDLSAFVAPAQFAFGNAGRGILVGPGDFTVDAGIHREFPINDRFRAIFRWEMFNAFNRANFATPNATIGNPQAGQISDTGAPRIMQLALKLTF